MAQKSLNKLKGLFSITYFSKFYKTLVAPRANASLKDASTILAEAIAVPLTWSMKWTQAGTSLPTISNINWCFPDLFNELSVPAPTFDVTPGDDVNIVITRTGVGVYVLEVYDDYRTLLDPTSASCPIRYYNGIGFDADDATSPFFIGSWRNAGGKCVGMYFNWEQFVQSLEFRTYDLATGNAIDLDTGTEAICVNLPMLIKQTT